MRKQLLHPATLIATLALLVALELPSEAARLIDGKLLKRASVSGAKLENGSVGARKLRKSVRADLERAGTPGPAGPAGPKGDTGARGPAGIGQLSCPSGTALHELACIELVQRAAATWFEAVSACEAVDRRLPSVAELVTYRARADLDAPVVGSEWIGDVANPLADPVAATIRYNDGLIGTEDADDSQVTFRCVKPATIG